MKRLPKGTKAQIMGTRLFQTMYTADQMRKAVADEREACAKVVDHMASRCNDIRAAALESAAENIRARRNI